MLGRENMKINFENKTINGYREIYHQNKRVLETTDSVVPDTNDDIGKIVSIQTSVLLKSKDVTARGVQISGEAIASLIYITEGEKAVSYVRLTKAFTIDYELSDVDADLIAQIKLDIVNTEARILNPRKVSVTFEIAGELSCYVQETIVTETFLPPNTGTAVHTRVKEAELVCTNAVCEKTFTLSEQFMFPGGKPVPSQLISQKAEFNVNDSQLVGTKLIIKGTMGLTALYLSDEVNYPVSIDFSTSFSQIIDMGQERMDSCIPMIELSTIYYDLISTINGEKALDVEIHAVLQLVSRCKCRTKYIADVYSNLLPAECSLTTHTVTNSAAVLQTKMITDERISVSEDCADVLSVFTNLSQLTIHGEKISAAVTLDIVYRTKSSTLASVRRLISLNCDCVKTAERIIKGKLSDVYLRPDGDTIDAHVAVEVKYQSIETNTISHVTAVALDEEAPYDFASFPAVSLVRADKEELWELAKVYHSSVERIEQTNQLADGYEGKLLLIPKAI